MEFRILGPIEVRNEAGVVALGGKKPRAVLAVLLLRANEPVSAERLALALWGEDVPGSAVRTVQVHVSRLRKAIGDPDVIATTPAGYRLRVGAGELDAERFERLVDQGHMALGDGQHEHAASLFSSALALWRGTPLAELVNEPFAAAEIARLEEQRLAALEARVEADLAAGRYAALVAELALLVADNPTRERFAGQLMLALYRCGRQAEALEAYTRARRVLLSEIGIEPGPDLRALHDAILRQDAALQPAAITSRLPPELDAATSLPLVGRDRERSWLGDHWKRASQGAGGLVTIVGARGIGKSRLAAEIAGECHRAGASVLYVAGVAPAETSGGTLARALEVTEPMLVVVDDADRGGEELRSALEQLGPSLAERPVLVVVTSESVTALAGLRERENLALEPLDLASIAAIASDYAPGVQRDRIPANWLLEVSGGVPSRVHEAASKWAHREAAQRVGAAAGRAASERAALRSIEAELTEGVADLQAAGERGGNDSDDSGPIVCPFKGLASFDVGDAPYFHGRERLTAELVARLVGAPLIGIVGPSGSGKSSVMRAGLLPALAGGVLPGSEKWEQILIRPGAHPHREFDEALRAGIGNGRDMVLAVDQFEETFTACADEQERAAFADALAAAASDRGARCVVVLAIRADFYGRCAAYPELASLLAANHVLVGPMRSDELRRAIEGPSTRAGLRVDGELTDALVGDVEGEPGALPLLSTALLELWQRREGRHLRHVAYERSGGVRGAVSRLAEDAFGQLDVEQQEIARSVLMRLIGEGPAGTIERQHVALAELETLRSSEDVARVVALLTDRRLVTVGAGTVELAHEALLREWPRLRSWIEDNRDQLRIQRNLGSAAQEWVRLEGDEGALYRGVRLSEALDWMAAGAPALTDLERDFIAASEGRLRRDRRTRRRGIMVAFLGLVAVIVAISVFAVMSLSRSREATRQRNVAASRELAARSAGLLAIDPGLSRLVALAAYQRSDTAEAEAAVRQAALTDRAVAILPADADELLAVAPSADGRLVATAGGADGAVRIWDLRRRRLRSTITGHRAAVTSVALSPDSERVASASMDGTVAIADADGASRHTLLTIASGPEDTYPSSVQFSPGGRRLVVGARNGAGNGARNGSVQLVDPANRTPPRILGQHIDAVSSARFNSSGTEVVSAGDDGVVRIWKVATRRRRATLRHGHTRVFDATFSPDGRRVATASEDGLLRIWNVATGRPAIEPVAVVPDTLNSVSYSADGSRLVTASNDGVVRLFDAHQGVALGELAGHVGFVQSAVFARNEIISGGEDGALRIWDPPDGRAIASHATPPGPQFSSDKRHVVWGDYSGQVHRWDTAAGRDRTVPALAARDATIARESGDRSRIVSASLDGSVRVYDATNGGSRRLRTDSKKKYTVAIDRRGARVAYGGVGPLELQTLDGGLRVRARGQSGEVHGLAFSPDGRHLASASADGKVRIFDAVTGRRELTLPGHADTVISVAYDRRGTRLVTAGSDATVRIWPLRGGTPLTPLRGGTPLILFGHHTAVESAVFNARGDRIVSASDDGTVRVWDAATGAALVIVTSYRSANGADFSALGDRIVSAGDDGNPAGGAVRVSSCEVCGGFGDALRLARSRATRQLSPSDRRQLLTGGGSP